MGQPLELALRVAILGVELGRRLGLPEIDLSDIYYLALVRHVGCTSDSLEFAAYNGGDDVGLRRHAIVWPSASPPEVQREIELHVGEGRPAEERSRLVAEMLAAGRQRPLQVAVAHCEAGGRLAARLGLPAGVRSGLLQEQERWDGHGLPEGLAGEALSIAQRVVSVAHDALVLNAAGGSGLGVIRRRSGTAYDPDVVQGLLDLGRLEALEAGVDSWTAALAAEPEPWRRIASDDVERVALACADFVDLKSPWLLGHSVRVAELASAAAAQLDASPEEVETTRCAGLLHDLGRVSVPNGIWDKRGPLSAAERERVRLHAYYTERILARSSILAPVAVIAGGHHENLDGSGYHRGAGAGQLPRAARVLRAADAFEAMGADRPHRPALTDTERVSQLRMEVETGRLDAAAVAAVIEAGGGERIRLRAPRPAGLSEREAEVLRMLVHGHTNAEIGAALHLSPKTVGHHVQHIYDKTGVSSRAAVALFAMEAGLV
jgi:HD-GYP domain-containing protein (c-di-GMP phosphodiesterase class II)